MTHRLHRFKLLNVWSVITFLVVLVHDEGLGPVSEDVDVAGVYLVGFGAHIYRLTRHLVLYRVE